MHVVEAKHLMKKDIGMLGKGKSDPYAIITVGAQEFKTKVISNSVDPKWDYWCEVIFNFCRLKSALNNTARYDYKDYCLKFICISHVNNYYTSTLHY